MDFGKHTVLVSCRRVRFVLVVLVVVFFTVFFRFCCLFFLSSLQKRRGRKKASPQQMLGIGYNASGCQHYHVVDGHHLDMHNDFCLHHDAARDESTKTDLLSTLLLAVDG